MGRKKRISSSELVDETTGEVTPALESAADGDELQRKSIATDYEKALKSVKELGELTKSPAWQRFYSGLQRRKRDIKDSFPDIEKAKDIIKAQMTIKAIDTIMAEVKFPVDQLMNLVAQYPLYAPSMKTRAQWDENSGRVTIVENP